MNSANINLQFPKHIALTLLGVGILVLYPLSHSSSKIIIGVIAGTMLSVINAVIGFVIVEYSFNKLYTQFMQLVMAGLVLRLFIMVGLLLVVLIGLKLDTLSLVGSLFCLYIVFLVLEIAYINNKSQQKLQTPNLH